MAAKCTCALGPKCNCGNDHSYMCPVHYHKHRFVKDKPGRFNSTPTRVIVDRDTPSEWHGTWDGRVEANKDWLEETPWELETIASTLEQSKRYHGVGGTGVTWTIEEEPIT